MIKQRLTIDLTKTNNYKITLRDDTGRYSLGNPEGYGGNNGNPISKIWKYKFILKDILNGTEYSQIQSNDIENTDEFHNPSIERIANKEEVELHAENFNLSLLPDSIYTVKMITIYDVILEGEGFENTSTLNNISALDFLLENYDGITDTDYYYTISNNSDLDSNTLIIDELLKQNITEFLPTLITTSEPFILNTQLEDCINSHIAKYACKGCETDNAMLNSLTELQLMFWGMKQVIKKGDFMQAKDYFLLASKLCKTLNCNC